jgi:hypothetical protein
LLQAWAALPVIFRGGRGRLRCHHGRSTLAGRRHAHRRLRVQGKARLRPDPAKLVISVGRALARRTVIVALPEQIDVTNAASVAEQLTSAVSCHPAVLIDMTATRFCDCAGARAIMRAYVPPTAAPSYAWWSPRNRCGAYSASSGSIACLRCIPAWRQRAAMTRGWLSLGRGNPDHVRARKQCRGEV